MNLFKRELTSLVGSPRDFLDNFGDTSKIIQIPLPKPKVDNGFTKSKDNLFAHYYNDNIENPNRQIRLSFRFGNNNSCVFSIKKSELHGNHFIFTEIVKLNHSEFHQPFKNRYYVANKCEINESNYDVSRIHPRLWG